MSVGVNAQAVDKQAIAHLVRTHNAGIDPDNDHAFSAWRAADLSHEAAAVKMLLLWEDSTELNKLDTYETLLGAPTIREQIVTGLRALGYWLRGPWFIAPRLALMSACLAVFFVYSFFWDVSPTPVAQTKVAEVRELALNDGSIVTLGAKSALLDVDYSPKERLVKMGVGEAFFEVTGNEQRPFMVAVGDALIRVVGTKFNIKYDGSQVKISVLQGVVQVSSQYNMNSDKTQIANMVSLVAGQQATVLDQQSALPAVAAVIGDPPGTWREGRLSYTDASLAEIIADANRYRSGQILIVSPGLADERLTTSFRTSQVDQMLETLPDALDVRVERSADGTVEVRYK